VPCEELLNIAEEYAGIILRKSQQAIRSAKETILKAVERPFDDTFRLDNLYGYSCMEECNELKGQLSSFFKDDKNEALSVFFAYLRHILPQPQSSIF